MTFVVTETFCRRNDLWPNMKFPICQNLEPTMNCKKIVNILSWHFGLPKNRFFWKLWCPLALTEEVFKFPKAPGTKVSTQYKYLEIKQSWQFETDDDLNKNTSILNTRSVASFSKEKTVPNYFTNYFFLYCFKITSGVALK